MTTPPAGVLPLTGRVLVRSLPASAPHFWRERGQWCCRSRLGPWGYGSSADEAHADWKAARLQWANTIPEQGKSPQLTVHLGHILTENCHVQPPTTLRHAG